MTTFSVLVPFVPSRCEHVLPYAAFVQHRSPQRLWQGQSLGVEPHQMFAFIAAAGFRIPVGIGVTLMPLRHPLEAALQARSLATITSHPVVAGYGTGAPETQAGTRGAPYERPLVAVREYLTIVRALLAGEQIEYHGTYFTVSGGLPVLPGGQSVELGVGVLRPRMARLAGELADVAITWLTPPAYLADRLLPAMRGGAAGRTTPRVVAMVPVALRAENRDPVELALASYGVHLQFPHYVDMFHQAGVSVDVTDPSTSARALAEAGVFCYGDPPEVVKQLHAYRMAGVDEVVVNMTGVSRQYGARTALTDLMTLFEEIQHGDG